jgi:hypothetical protein
MMINATDGNIIMTIASKLTIKRNLSEFWKTLKKGLVNLSKGKPTQEN